MGNVIFNTRSETRSSRFRATVRINIVCIFYLRIGKRGGCAYCLGIYHYGLYIRFNEVVRSLYRSIRRYIIISAISY